MNIKDLDPIKMFREHLDTVYGRGNYKPIVFAGLDDSEITNTYDFQYEGEKIQGNSFETIFNGERQVYFINVKILPKQQIGDAGIEIYG